MDGLVPILVAIIGSSGTVIGAFIGARYMAGRRGRGARSTPGGPTDVAVAAGWRQQAELEKARADLMEEQRDDERDARQTAIARIVVLEGQLSTTRHDLDDCVRQREAAFSELRNVERRRQPRAPA